MHEYLPPWSLARLCLPAACSMMSFKTITSAQRKRTRTLAKIPLNWVEQELLTFHIHNGLAMDGFNKRIVITMFYFASLISVIRSVVLNGGFIHQFIDFTLLFLFVSFCNKCRTVLLLRRRRQETTQTRWHNTYIISMTFVIDVGVVNAGRTSTAATGHWLLRNYWLISWSMPKFLFFSS